MTQQRAHACKPASKRSRADALVTAAGEKGTQIRNAQAADIFQRWRLTKMTGQEIEKLARVALIASSVLTDRRRASFSVFSHSSRAAARSARAGMRNSPLVVMGRGRSCFNLVPVCQG